MNTNRLEFKKEMFGNESYAIPFPDAVNIREIFREISPFIPKNVIDLGCSNGFFSSTFNTSYMGLDISKARVEQCNLMNINAVEYDIENTLPIKDKSIECVISVNTLEHIYDTFSHLKEMKRVLTNNGFILLVTPNISSFSSRIKVLLGKRPPNIDCARSLEIEDKIHCQDHITAFAKEDLEKLFDLAGLKIIKFRGYDNGRFLRILNWFTNKNMLVSLTSSFIIVAKRKTKEKGIIVYPIVENDTIPIPVYRYENNAD